MRSRPNLRPVVIQTELSPTRFNGLTDLIKSVGREDITGLDTFIDKVSKLTNDIRDEADQLAKANNAMLSEVRQTTRRQNPFTSVEEQEDLFSDLRNTISGNNFLRIIFDVMSAMLTGFEAVQETAQGIRPGPLYLSGKKYTIETQFDFETMQRMQIELEMNEPTLMKFVNGVLQADQIKALVISLGRLLTDQLDRYYSMLLRRHSVEGIHIHGDPVATDVAISIFENVDAHGEIQDGKKPDEISAYSMRKATIIADAIKNGLVGVLIEQPDKLIDFIVDHMKDLWQLAKALHTIAKPLATKIRTIFGSSVPRSREMNDSEFEQALIFLKDLDPRNITYKEKTGLLSAEERFSVNFQNDTLRHVVGQLKSKADTDTLIRYILDRKHELRQYYQDENSFYVCKIGNGNPFTGDAPGELTVIPGTRPVVNLDEIIGSGFDDVKSFITQVESTSKWHDLFLATSPSRTADKSNVLLVGPQGCGKSEILRAMGGDKKSIGVFATGSDFLTCWKGEAEKNPKRLFEAALKLQKESKKHVHILIDEIDTILNKNTGREAFGNTNLVTEFQNLMDGVVHYPNISVWGATNNPEALPMPCLRRFSKVLIVGELEQADRIRLLKHFVAFMPVEDISDEEWGPIATRLEGATGDVIRKVIDHVWRERMSWFVNNNREQAKLAADFLETMTGQKFAIHSHTGKNRQTFNAILGQFVKITKQDVERSVDQHLEMIAIHHEIETAKATYAGARAFLSQLKSGQTNA